MFDGATWQAVAASIDGYTSNYGSVGITDELPKNPESLHATSMVDSGTTHEFTFVYTKQPTKVTINYVDDEQDEKVVGTGTVSGKTGTEVTITPQLPKGYMLTPDKDVPSTYTVTDTANQAVTIHVQKQFVDLSDTDPQAKQTRTITLHYVYGAGDKQGQPAFDDAVLDVYYHRTATFDRVTNQTTYGDWTWDRSQGDTSTPGYHVVSGKWTSLPQTWANVAADVPSIKGYYADLGQNDPTNTNHVPSNTWVFPTYNNSLGGGISEGGKGATAYLDGYGYEVSPTHTVKYMPNQTTVTVNYVDDDNNGVNVGHQSWNGTTGQHIELTLTLPDNYVLTPGWVNPTSYDFDGTNSSWYTVHVKHKTQDVTEQEPKDQVTKTETLTRKHLYGPGPHEGENFCDPDIIEVPWHRTAAKDLVTGKVNFGDWHVVWDKVKQLSGVTKMWGDSEHNWVNGGLMAGYSGYSFFGVGTKAEAITTDGTVSGHAFYWMGEQDIEKNPTIVQYYGRERVDVPVKYVDFDTDQWLATKDLTGDDYLDGNTITFNKGDLTDWGKAVSNNYQLYAGQTLPTTYKIDTVSNDGNLTPITVYVVQPRTVQFTFVDNDNTVNGQHPQVGDAVSVTGITGSTTPVNLTVPAGYKLVEGQQLPTTYTFVKGGQNQVILLTHQHVTVNPDSPKTPADKLPDNPDKAYPTGVSETDLNKTVTRTIKVTTPDGQTKSITQTAKLTRTADVDEVTGEVKYSDWTTGNWSSYTAPSVLGYTASQSHVAQQAVTGATEDQTVNITYTANEHQISVEYVDNATGQVVKTDHVSGKTGQTVSITPHVPDGWELYDGQNVPKDITFKAHNDNQDFVIKHVLSLVSADNIPAAGSVIKGTKAKTYPEGLTSDMLTKTITRTIQVMKDGHQVGTKTQKVTFIRNAVVDAVTGSVKTLAWSEDGSHVFTAYQPASIDGYTVDGVKAMTVNPLNEPSITLIVNYKAVPQALNVIYQTTDGQQVGSTASMVADKEGQIDLTSQLPSGYELATPVKKTNVSDLHVNNYYVTVKPQLRIYTSEDADIPSGVYLTKVVNRTINITLPNGKHKTIHQTVNFNRMVTIDANGNSTYTDWKAVGTDTFDGVRLPVRHGYKLVFDDGSNGIKAQQVTNAEIASDVVINVSYVKA